MRKRIISPAYLAIITALLTIIGISACKSTHQTKYGPPPVDRIDAQANASIDAERSE